MELHSCIQKTFPILEKSFSQKDINDFAKAHYVYLTAYHFKMGTWIRNNLLGKETLLFQTFLRADIKQLDEMSQHIVTLFYFHLRTRD